MCEYDLEAKTQRLLVQQLFDNALEPQDSPTRSTLFRFLAPHSLRCPVCADAKSHECTFCPSKPRAIAVISVQISPYGDFMGRYLCRLHLLTISSDFPPGLVLPSSPSEKNQTIWISRGKSLVSHPSQPISRRFGSGSGLIGDTISPTSEPNQSIE